MKTTLVSEIINKVIKDRLLLLLFAGFIILSIIFCLYIGFSLHGSDVQIATRYTSFGTTNYYRNQWYYLFTFLGFGVITLSLNTAIAIKMCLEDRAVLARMWLLICTGFMAISILLVHSILGIAYL